MLYCDEHKLLSAEISCVRGIAGNEASVTMLAENTQKQIEQIERTRKHS